MDTTWSVWVLVFVVFVGVVEVSLPCYRLSGCLGRTPEEGCSVASAEHRPVLYLVAAGCPVVVVFLCFCRQNLEAHSAATVSRPN